jgi:3-isopropylmalate/(R)-2-methylmalate dehydratase large subunit
MYEVTSPQAFEGLRLAKRQPWRARSVIATCDHNVPTTSRAHGIADPLARLQVETLSRNCAEFGITEFGLNDQRQGIVHVMAPEQEVTLPGMTVVCGDSHTSTHGALADLAFGIGTSDIEHVLATQCLWLDRMLPMRVQVGGVLPPGLSAKDVILAIIRRLGAGGGTGYAIEFAGSVVQELSMEGRMTLCNMAIEAGSRVGLVAVDQKTLDYVRGRPFSPGGEMWARADTYWRTLVSDSDACFARILDLDGSTFRPLVTWGTSPDMVATVDENVPNPTGDAANNERLLHNFDDIELTLRHAHDVISHEKARMCEEPWIFI